MIPFGSFDVVKRLNAPCDTQLAIDSQVGPCCQCALYTFEEPRVSFLSEVIDNLFHLFEFLELRFDY